MQMLLLKAKVKVISYMEYKFRHSPLTPEELKREEVNDDCYFLTREDVGRLYDLKGRDIKDLIQVIGDDGKSYWQFPDDEDCVYNLYKER